jgi:hypothetical protein
MAEKITTLSTLKWFRDKFAAWFVTSWLYLILWAVVGIAFAVLLYIDGIFSRSLAPESIEPLSFQAMGWAYRLFAASFLIGAARCVIKGAPGKWTFRILGGFASVIVVLHAFGFGLEALSDRRDQAFAARDVSTVQVDTIADQRELLEARKAQIDADLERALVPINQEIYNLDNDGKLNEELTTQMRDRRTALQDRAAEQKSAIDQQIMALVSQSADARTETIETAADEKPWHPLFIGLSQIAFVTWDPTDRQIYLAAVAFVFFWVLLAESLVVFLPERLYVLHMTDADQIGSQKEAEQAEEFAKRSAAAKKGAATRRRGMKIEKSKVWWKNRVETILSMRRQGYTTEEIARSYGWTIEAMRMYLRDYVTRDELSFIFQTDASSGTDEADANDEADAKYPDDLDAEEKELVDEEEPVDDDDADDTASS